MRIRFARPEDAAALLAIYTPYVTSTCITFETEVPSAEEFAARISHTFPQYPYLVCEEEGKPVGYAYAGRYGARAAYDWSTELSVYLAPNARQKGYGKALYRLLLQLLTAQGYCAAYGRIALPNDASCRLHEQFGFRTIGVEQKVGFKQGQWVDLICYEKPLCAQEGEPAPIRPVTEILSRFPEFHFEEVL